MTLRTLLFITLTAFIVAQNAAAWAQQNLNPGRDDPLEITADQTLEWHRNDKQYIARGNVIVHQGTVTIHADTLTADYRETSASAFEIYRLTAAGSVRIVSQGNTATGTQAVYDVDRGVAVMTGDNLRLTSPDQDVTAQQSFEYWVTDGKLTARGNAVVKRAGGDTLRADTVSAVFAEDAGGSRQLKRLNADGNVKITTPTEVLTGNKGQYEAATNIAQITGHVKIARGPNVLEGESAEVNLTTNVSTMKGSPAQGGRVRGVFYPGSEKKPDITHVPAPAPQQAPQQMPQTMTAPQVDNSTPQRQPMLLAP